MDNNNTVLGIDQNLEALLCYVLGWITGIVFLFLISLLIPTSVLAQDSSEIPFDRLKTPTELQDIIDTFDRLKYNFVSFDEEEKVQEFVIEYQYQGKEDVNGVQADKIFISSSTMK